MKHIKLYENFEILNEGVSYNDIMQIADRDLPTKTEFGRPGFIKDGNPPAFTVELTKKNVSKLNPDFLNVWLTFYPKADTLDAKGGCQGDIYLNSFHYRKIITPQELAKIQNVEIGPVNDLISDIKNCWIGVCNGDARQVEIMDLLEENGWKKLKD
jgi:hypothetical protein